MHQELLTSINKVYQKCNLKFSTPVAEEESQDYGAYYFKVNERPIRFRVAKITPTKTGQFVTVWQRENNGPIKPFAIDDDVDLFVICARYKEHLGQFVFPKSILVKQGILSQNSDGGKRAFRIYPPWDSTLNSQAQKTQNWQLNYFLNLTGENCDYDRAAMLYAAC